VGIAHFFYFGRKNPEYLYFWSIKMPLPLPNAVEQERETIRAQVEKMGADLVDLEFCRQGGTGILTILADKTGGITLEECAAINRALGERFEAWSLEKGLEFIPGPYLLEVSSPGLDRPLRSEADFRRAIGATVRVVTRPDAEGRTQVLTGAVRAVGATEVELEAQGEVRRLPLESIGRAVREIGFKGKKL
jgi:ribosome maturation factor RimP